MRSTIDPILFPHYGGMEIDVEPNENVKLISNELFQYFIKERFQNYQEWHDDYRDCIKSSDHLLEFYNDLIYEEITNGSGQAEAMERMKEMIRLEIGKLNADLTVLMEQFDETLDELLNELNQRGCKFLPDLKNAAMTYLSDNAGEVSTMQGKERHTMDSLRERYNSIKRELYT